MLRESMRELGLDKGVEKAASAIPDARDRLNYIANMTEQAATRVLNAIDAARPVQDALESDAEAHGKPIDFERLYFRGDTFQYRLRLDRHVAASAQTIFPSQGTV